MHFSLETMKCIAYRNVDDLSFDNNPMILVNFIEYLNAFSPVCVLKCKLVIFKVIKSLFFL